MKFWTPLSLLGAAVVHRQQIFELTATRLLDGTCDVHTWRPTQLHKDLSQTNAVHIERQPLSVNVEEGLSVLLRVYGYEREPMFRVLEGECSLPPADSLWIAPPSNIQSPFALDETVEPLKPLPAPPPLKLTPLLTSGPSDNRVDLVFFSDGYTAEEESKFLADAERLAVDISANQTFATVKPLLNIWAAFTPSNNSGIGTDIEPKDTAFGLYRVGTELRAIYCGKKPVARAACISLGTMCDYPVLLANSPYYGGLGGEFSISTASLLNGALVLRHELGHSIIKVGEEYDGGYAYFGPNSSPSPPTPKFKWKHWISNPYRFSNGNIVPERAVSPLQAYPWTLLNRSTPYRSLFNSSGAYSSHMLRFSLSGLPEAGDLTVLLDGVDVGWKPRQAVGIDRWHYDIMRDSSLSEGPHNLTFSLGNSAVEGRAQLCSFEIIEYGGITEFNRTVGHIGAYPTFSMWNGTTYRPTNEGCLMRQVVLPHFCKPCSEGLWLQLLKRVDLIDEIAVTQHASEEKITIHLTPVRLGQFREESLAYQESLELSWALNGTLLPQYDGKVRIVLPYSDAIGTWRVRLRFKTPEVKVDTKGYLKTSAVFSIPNMPC